MAVSTILKSPCGGSEVKPPPDPEVVLKYPMGNSFFKAETTGVVIEICTVRNTPGADLE
jgi:hypothetical protein